MQSAKYLGSSEGGVPASTHGIMPEQELHFSILAVLNRLTAATAMRSPPSMPELYADHVRLLQCRFEAVAERLGLDAVVIGSGVEQLRFLDDQPYRYTANPHFLQWAPLQEHPGSAVVVQPGQRPVLVVHRPEDYWHQPPPLPSDDIAAHFEVHIVRDSTAIAALLPDPKHRTAILGPPEQWTDALPAAVRNPDGLLNFLHFHRACKTAWEVACIRQAAFLAALGHQAAENSFRSGGSEFDILLAFLDGCRQLEDELPYGAIVALNEHGATLHYQKRERAQDNPDARLSLLIDAGCSHLGYASDVTRTHARHDGEFAGMITDMIDLQRHICMGAHPGVAFADLHRQAHHALARLLRQWDVVRMAPEDMVECGVTSSFFPHGLGHFLGLQVHDVGGHLADDCGGTLTAPVDFPRLRLLRALAPGQVVTIEPGVYFIESLLAGLRAGPHAASINWNAIARLRQYGGIRIEDDLLITEDGSENLSQASLGH